MKTAQWTLAAGIIGAALTGCTALLGSYDVGAGSADAGGSTSDGQGSDGNVTGADGSVGEDGSASDAPVVCTGSDVACGKVCAPLSTSRDHCGKCGHSCGGATCQAGQCQPLQLFTGTDAVGRLDVADINVFFASTDGVASNRLLACPKSGCTVAPTQIASMSYPINQVAVVQKGAVVFESAPTQSTERPTLYACGIAGCPSPPVSFTQDGLNGYEGRLRVVADRVFYNSGGNGLAWSSCAANGGPCTAAHFLGSAGSAKGTTGFSADTTNVYFVDSMARGSAIATCLQTDTACMPAPLVAGPQSDVFTTAADGGKLYWIKRGRDGFTEAKLFVCDLPGCATPKPIAVGLDSPTELVVDASGAYWLTAGNKLQRCSPGGCAGGPQDFAGTPTALDSPHSLVADAAFVYWAEKSSVWRLAKP